MQPASGAGSLANASITRRSSAVGVRPFSPRIEVLRGLVTVSVVRGFCADSCRLMRCFHAALPDTPANGYGLIVFRRIVVLPPGVFLLMLPISWVSQLGLLTFALPLRCDSLFFVECIPILCTRGLRANGTKTYAKEITNCYN